MNDAGNLDRPVEDVRRELRSVFAHFGMGPGAQCLGAQLAGIVADHTEGSG
jgi:hypothetical protein